MIEGRIVPRVPWLVSYSPAITCVVVKRRRININIFSFKWLNFAHLVYIPVTFQLRISVALQTVTGSEPSKGYATILAFLSLLKHENIYKLKLNWRIFAYSVILHLKKRKRRRRIFQICMTNVLELFFSLPGCKILESSVLSNGAKKCFLNLWRFPPAPCSCSFGCWAIKLLLIDMEWQENEEDSGVNKLIWKEIVHKRKGNGACEAVARCGSIELHKLFGVSVHAHWIGNPPLCIFDLDIKIIIIIIVLQD